MHGILLLHERAHAGVTRIAAQLPLARKRPFATWEIDNAGSREATEAQVDSVLAAMQAMT